MSLRSLLLVLRVPGQSFRGGKYAQVVVIGRSVFELCEC